MDTLIARLQGWWSSAQLQWADSRKRKAARQTASALSNADPTVPFVSRYTLRKDQPFSSKVDIKEIDGLLSLHVVLEHNQKELIAYWKSRDHFKKSRDSLDEKLGVTTTSQGLLSLVLLAPKRWNEWLTVPNLWAAIATLVAVFSTTEALRNDYSWLLGTPKITVAESEGIPNFTIGEPIKIDRGIVNTGRCNARIEIRKRSILVVNESGRQATDTEIEILKEMPEMAELEPNKSDVFHFRATGLKAGIFDIEFRGRLTNGWLGKKDWRGLKQRIRVWQDYAITASPDKIACPSDFDCYLSGLIQLGRPTASGVKCEAWLEKNPGVSIDTVQMPGGFVASTKHLPRPAGESSDTVSKLEWYTKPIERFTETWFTLGLKSDTRRSKEAWAQIARAVKLQVSNAQ
jgi:hypothetical protein